LKSETFNRGRRCNAVSIATKVQAGLAEAQFPATARHFARLRNVQNGSGVHAASYFTEISDPIPRGKAAKARSGQLTSAWCQG